MGPKANLKGWPIAKLLHMLLKGYCTPKGDTGVGPEAVCGFMLLVLPHPQNRQKSFLGNIDAPDALHAPLPFLLLFQQLALAADVASVALGDYVLSHGGHGFPGNDFGTDSRLDRNFKHLPWNQLAHLRYQRPAALVSKVFVHDD